MFESSVLGDCRKRKIIVKIILVNGFQLRGTIVSYDDKVVIVQTDGAQQMIYKHAISTIDLGSWNVGV